eukprot:2908210-Amphidinium_carterae.1
MHDRGPGQQLLTTEGTVRISQSLRFFDIWGLGGLSQVGAFATRNLEPIGSNSVRTLLHVIAAEEIAEETSGSLPASTSPRIGSSGVMRPKPQNN